MKRIALIALVFALLAPIATAQTAPKRALGRVDFERMLRVVEREPRCVDCAWPIVGGAVLVVGSSYDLHQSSRGVEERVIIEGNPIVRRADGSVNAPASWALTGGSLAGAAFVSWKWPRLRKAAGVALGLVGCLRIGLGVRAKAQRDF